MATCNNTGQLKVGDSEDILGININIGVIHLSDKSVDYWIDKTEVYRFQKVGNSKTYTKGSYTYTITPKEIVPNTTLPLESYAIITVCRDTIPTVCSVTTDFTVK